jgi:hypothetical protein
MAADIRGVATEVGGDVVLITSLPGVVQAQLVISRTTGRSWFLPQIISR